MTKKQWEIEKANILEIAELDVKTHSYIRKGQAVFNASYEKFREVDWLRATIYDCFYNEDRVDGFLEQLGKILIEEEITEKMVEKEKKIFDGTCPFGNGGECSRMSVKNCNICPAISKGHTNLKDGFYILIVDGVKCAAKIEDGIIHDTVDEEGYSQSDYSITCARFIEEL